MDPCSNGCCLFAFGIGKSLPLEVCAKHAHDRRDFGNTRFASKDLQTKLQQVRGLEWCLARHAGDARLRPMDDGGNACLLVRSPADFTLFSAVAKDHST